MEVWPRRLDAFRTARSSAMASSSSSRRPGSALAGRRWFLCCFREPWLLRGAAYDGLAGPDRARGVESKLADATGGCGAAEKELGRERDLPGPDEFELIVGGLEPSVSRSTTARQERWRLGGSRPFDFYPTAAWPLVERVPRGPGLTNVLWPTSFSPRAIRLRNGPISQGLGHA